MLPLGGQLLLRLQLPLGGLLLPLGGLLLLTLPCRFCP